MNYLKHYTTLIERAIGRAIDGYTEKHHIVPRCVGGTDEGSNLVSLLPEEHFVAHQLLLKIHRDHKNYAKLLFATKMMTVKSTDHKTRTNKEYSWIKKRFSDNQTGNKNHAKRPDVRAKMSSSAKLRVARGILPDNTGRISSRRGERGIHKQTEYQKSVASIRAKGTRWYNNGTEEKMVKPADISTIVGWKQGRLPRSPLNKYNK